MITVIITVGPKEHHKRWLGECLESIRQQTIKADEILIIDDCAFLKQEEVGDDVRIWRTPWVSGSVHGVNFGVALAMNDLVLHVASDDVIRPWCIADCLAEYKRRQDPLGYYWLDVEYSDGRIQKLASGPSMVTKELWRHTGGLPLEGTIGAADFMFICAMNEVRGHAGRLWHVQSDEAPYWFRLHKDQIQSAQHARYGSVIGIVRDIINAEWVERFGQ